MILVSSRFPPQLRLLWSKFIQFVILFIWCANSVNSYCDSYPENYSERTLHHKLKDDQQKKVIQNQILNLFGLKERPNLTSERSKHRFVSFLSSSIWPAIVTGRREKHSLVSVCSDGLEQCPHRSIPAANTKVRIFCLCALQSASVDR